MGDSAPRGGTGDAAPHFSLTASKKSRRRSGGKENAWGLKPDPLWGRVWAETRGPSKRLRCKILVEALGAGPDSRKLLALRPRRKCFRASEGAGLV